MHNIDNRTASMIALAIPGLVRETRRAHGVLLQQMSNETAQTYKVIKREGDVQFAITTPYLPIDDHTVHRFMLNNDGHLLVASSNATNRLPQPSFEIVTKRGGELKRRADYRLWLARNGDSALLPAGDGRRPVWRIAEGRLVRGRSAQLNHKERREGFARADRMIRRLVRSA